MILSPLAGHNHGMTWPGTMQRAFIAQRDADSTTTIPSVLPQARAELTLNHSFIAATEKDPKQATALLATSRRYAARPDLLSFAEHLDIQEALIA